MLAIPSHRLRRPINTPPPRRIYHHTENLQSRRRRRPGLIRTRLALFAAPHPHLPRRPQRCAVSSTVVPIAPRRCCVQHPLPITALRLQVVEKIGCSRTLAKGPLPSARPDRLSGIAMLADPAARQQPRISGRVRCGCGLMTLTGSGTPWPVPTMRTTRWFLPPQVRWSARSNTSDFPYLLNDHRSGRRYGTAALSCTDTPPARLNERRGTDRASPWPLTAAVPVHGHHQPRKGIARCRARVCVLPW